MYLVICPMAHVVFLLKCVYWVRVSICIKNFEPKLFLKKSKTCIFSEIVANLDPRPLCLVCPLSNGTRCFFAQMCLLGSYEHICQQFEAKKNFSKRFKNFNIGQIWQKSERDTLYLVPCQMAHVLFMPKCTYSVHVSIYIYKFAPKLFLKK